MSTKHSELVKEYKAGFAQKLSALPLSPKQKIEVAAALGLSLSTVMRYTKGDVDEIRSLELAESIESTAKEILRAKKADAPAVV